MKFLENALNVDIHYKKTALNVDMQPKEKILHSVCFPMHSFILPGMVCLKNQRLYYDRSFYLWWCSFILRLSWVIPDPSCSMRTGYWQMASLILSVLRARGLLVDVLAVLSQGSRVEHHQIQTTHRQDLELSFREEDRAITASWIKPLVRGFGPQTVTKHPKNKRHLILRDYYTSLSSPLPPSLSSHIFVDMFGETQAGIRPEVKESMENRTYCTILPGRETELDIHHMIEVGCGYWYQGAG